MQVPAPKAWVYVWVQQLEENINVTPEIGKFDLWYEGATGSGGVARGREHPVPVLVAHVGVSVPGEHGDDLHTAALPLPAHRDTAPACPGLSS